MAERKGLIDWRSGGGLLLIASLLVAAAVGWRALSMLGSGAGAIGDGHNLDSYRFDLSSAVVPVDRLTPSGLPRDGIPALDHPPVMRATEVPAFNDAQRGKYLVSSDRVVGIVLGGETRAYPLRVLNWHEVVNDTLGGVPVAVTFSPLCDSVVVFDRRIGDDVVELAVSGLLINSNLVLYDRRPEPEESSLWSQLLARAVAGPAAGRRLTVLPASLATWGHWTENHPDTLVIRPHPDRLKRYRRNPYGSYLTTGKLRYPVEPLPPEGSLSSMAPVMVLESGGTRSVIPLPDGTGTGPGARAEIRGTFLEFAGAEGTVSVRVDPAAGAATYYARWFSWYSQYPESASREIHRPEMENSPG